MDISSSIQDSNVTTTTAVPDQSRLPGGGIITTTSSGSFPHLPPPHHHHLPPQTQYQLQQQQQHHHQNPFSSHMLSSPTAVTSSVDVISSPILPETSSAFVIGKLSASTSFSGSSTRSMSLSSSLKQPLQDSEDSSYDSDCEVSDATTSHNDVSRTVSDTLGQEFEEYVTLANRGPQQTASIVSSSVSSATGCVISPGGGACPPGVESFQFNPEDPNYKSKLEFAKKLGYTETQVQIVLSKLGPNPSQNELLNELILLDDNSGLNEIISTTENAESGSPVVGAGVASGGAQSTTGGSSAQAPSSSSSNLRHIVIDGSNLAMSHGNNKVFSCRGIKLAVDYFKARGHKKITVFVPSYRKEAPKPDDPVSDQHILTELEKEGILVYTPSRLLNNRRLICYDDRYILKLAVDEDGIVVSNDNYRDLQIESLDFKRVVEERLLMYSFANDRFMPPDDPFGRNGPKLDQLLSKSTVAQLPPPCPYGRKCTYGLKCKYYHSTQAKSVSETLRRQAMKTQSVPIALTSSQVPVCRTRSAIVPMESLKKDLTTMGGATNNPHRKLQRQLSINPGGDPRIHQTFHRGASLNSSTLPTSHHPHHHHLQHQHSGIFHPQQQDSYSLSPFPGNPTLSEVWKPADWTLPSSSSSSGARSPTSQGDWMKTQRSTHMAGTVVSTAPVAPPQKQQQQVAPTSSIGPSSPLASPGTSSQSRTTMYYHLAAIFPEHQVEHVMSLYPDCNDPSFICKEIVRLFK